MSDQFDILHPLTTLKWEQCGQIPRELRSLSQCVVVGEKIYMSFSTHLYVSTDLNSWTELPKLPASWGTFTTYRSQPVLATTNKLWSLSEAGVWQESLPPMPTKRRNPVFVNATDPECLMVMGRYDGYYVKGWEITGECFMEVLIGDQWFVAEYPPSGLLEGGVVHNGMLYIYGSSTGAQILCCDFQSLMASCRHPDPNNPLRWSKISIDPMECILWFGSFGQQLVMVCTDKMFAYHPLADRKSCVSLGHIPISKGVVLFAFLHAGGLLVTYQQYSYFEFIIMRLSLITSPYDPDSRFTMSSLTRLEAAGIKVVTALRDNIKYLRRKLSLPAHQYSVDSVQSVVEQWEVIKDYMFIRQEIPPPMTWRSLLHILSKGMNLKELSQQIEDYFQHGDANKQYLDAYHQILAKQETLEMWFLKVILLGAPRLGKTTVRRRLTGEIDDISSSGEGEQPSTGAVESGPSIVIRNLSSTTALITESEWLATKDLIEETCAILQYFYSHISEKKAIHRSPEVSDNVPSPSAEVNRDNIKDVDNRKADISPKVQYLDSISECVVEEATSEDTPSVEMVSVKPTPSAPVPASSDHDSYTPPPEYAFSIPEMIRNAVSPKLWREITQVCRDTAFLNMGDTGGQPEFMDMQPALTVGPALYLCFCKLTDDLDSLYKVSYLSPSTGESTVPRESAYSAKEVLFSSLASIACFRSSSSTSLGETTSSTADQLLASCNKSIAYIIGTHKDLVSEEQIDEFDKKLQQCIRPTDFFEENIVQFTSEERMVLPVDNMHGGSCEVNQVRKVLEESLKKHFKKLSIPASWLVLSLCLRKREERTASLESVLQLASELGIPQSEAMVALWFLHHYAGVLMYFPNLPDLKDTVICDNQIIYDSATNLIVNTFKFRSVGKAASERFRKTGRFSLEDIRRATTGVSGDYIPLEKLVKLLAFLNILVKSSLSSHTSSSEEMYFMPSVLLNATYEEMASWWDDTHKQVSPAPLFIRYKCGFVPIGVFPAMIANLTANAALQLRVEGIRKNRVQFHIGSDFDTITLVSQPTYYAVHISRRKSTKTPTHEVCATVRGLVESTLKTVTSQMNYTFTAEYQLGFECPSHPGREHLCVVDSDDPSPHIMCCQENMDNLKPLDMQSQHLVWFGEYSSQEDSGTGRTPRLQESKTNLCLSSLNNLLKWTDNQGQECEICLVNNVSSKWYEFGITLGLKLNQLDSWEAQHRGDTNKCWNKVMDDWLTRGGSRDYPATWEGLYSLLNDLGYGNVAVKLEKAVSGQVSHSN